MFNKTTDLLFTISMLDEVRTSNKGVNIMKKYISILIVMALFISLVGCSTTTTTYTEYASSSVVGKITEINGSKVALQLGELSETEMGNMDDSDKQEMGQNPSEENDGQKPNDEGMNNDPNGLNQPEKPDGQQPGESMDQQPFMDDKNGGSFINFTENEGNLIVDLSDVTIVNDLELEEVDDLSVDDIIKVFFDSKGAIKTVIVVSSDSNNDSSKTDQGTSANTLDSDGSYSGGSYESTGDDENALRIDNATVSLDSITVNKSAGSSSNTENGDFYGVNAALLTTNGATVNITSSEINSSVRNGNGVFSYGSGTTVNISDCTITTTGDSSGGIQTTGGATTNASDLTIVTSGSSSAAIRSDRGGGTVNVDKGSYTTHGYNSPAVYSTANITVSNAELTANNSEALVIEGDNSITLNDCKVSGKMSDDKGTSSDENVHNVMIYQSMSGDAQVGTSIFTMTAGSLTSKNGDMFYVTNTHCIITLSNVEIINEDSDAYLLKVSGNSASHGWGSAGANGAQVEFNCDSQTLEGDIVVDSISTLNMTLKNGSLFTGSINIITNEQNGIAVSDNVVVTIESGCTWNLTGDCTITSLTSNGTINYNGHSITLADGTVLK